MLSRGPSLDDGAAVYGSLLSAADRKAIATFVEEFVSRGLLGFVERQMRSLNEIVTGRSRLGTT